MSVMSFIIFCGVVSLIYGVVTGKSILSKPAGSEKMVAIASAIQEGAKAYLNRQYITIGLVGVVICALLSVKLGLFVGIGFAIGAICSGLAGYIGMNISVRANVRTAEAAKSGLQMVTKLNSALNSAGASLIILISAAINSQK